MSRILCRISKAGRVEPWVMEEWLAAVEPKKGKDRVWVSLEDEDDQRTSAQNRLYFRNVVTPVMEYYNRLQADKGLLPYTRDDIHDVLAKAFYGTREGPLNQTIRKETSKMPKDKFSVYIEKIQAYYSQQPFCLAFPTGEDLVG